MPSKEPSLSFYIHMANSEDLRSLLTVCARARAA